jgi:type IV/VI secretion system ImpK/VasF family protein
VSAIYWGSAEVLIAALGLGTDRDLPPPAQLRERLGSSLQQMVSRCKALGVADGDIAEAHYALVAFIDERILKSNWPGRAEWMSSPLQLQIYREFRAGENFFARMGELLQRAPTSAALEIYYLCLALGFIGAHGPENARSFLEAYRTRAPRGSASGPLSPHALPGDHYSLVRPRRPFALAIAAGCAAAVALGLGLLWWSLGGTIATTASELGALDLGSVIHG